MIHPSHGVQIFVATKPVDFRKGHDGLAALVPNFKLYLASKPVDFRKGMDGLAAIVMNEFDFDPFSGAIFIFRSKRSDRMKLIVWDGTGLVMTYKRIEGSGFVWPRMTDGVITINRSQFEALFEGLDWQRVVPRHVRKPVAV